MFIVIEGADAVGKNTQADALAKYLVGQNECVVQQSFPRYATPLGEDILAMLKADPQVQGINMKRLLQCAMTVDKYDATPELVRSVSRGWYYVSNRWWQSAYVYGAADGLDTSWLVDIHRRLPEPDINILIDLDVTEAAARRPEARDRYEKDKTLQARVVEGYRSLWRENRENRRWVVIDGGPSPEEVTRAIMKTIARRR